MVPALRELRRRRLAWTACAVAAVCLSAFAAPTAQPGAASPACSVETKERVVSIADVHGAFDKFVVILREAGLVDKDNHWSGGHTVFVQTGDILDRGPDSRKALDLLRKLEGEASKAGGHLYFLLGNHETMRMTGDRTYVSAKEYDAFRSVDSIELRDHYEQNYIAAKMQRAAAAGQKFDQNAEHKKFLEEIPLGSVEMQQAFTADGDYGRWLRQHDAMVMVNGIAFLHAGADAATAALGCTAINATVHKELQNPPKSLTPEEIKKWLIVSPTGPLWYRGLVRAADGHEGSEVSDAEYADILKTLGARAMVVGHTVTSDAKIHVLFGGRLFQTDTGMLGDYGKSPERPNGWWPGGKPSALEIVNGTFTAIYEGGKREVLIDPAPRAAAGR